MLGIAMLPVTAFEAPHSFDFKEIYIIVLEGSRSYTSVLMGEIKHQKYFSSPRGKTPTLILRKKQVINSVWGIRDSDPGGSLNQ